MDINELYVGDIILSSELYEYQRNGQTIYFKLLSTPPDCTYKDDGLVGKEFSTHKFYSFNIYPPRSDNRYSIIYFHACEVEITAIKESIQPSSNRWRITVGNDESYYDLCKDYSSKEEIIRHYKLSHPNLLILNIRRVHMDEYHELDSFLPKYSELRNIDRILR